MIKAPIFLKDEFIKEKYLLKRTDNRLALLKIQRYKNNNIKAWELWDLNNNKKMFVANQKTSTLILLDIFKKYRILWGNENKNRTINN